MPSQYRSDNPAGRRAFVVVGMHRSGTSAMTRMLSLLGAALPKKLMSPQEDNPAGFWEAQSVADLNDEILQALDSEWDDVFSFRSRNYLSNFDRFYMGRAVDLLDQEFSDSEVIVLKEPRISILASFWNRALREAGYTTHYVVMVRNPLEVAESLLARNRFPREKSLLLWSSYMLAVERDTRQEGRTFVAFEQIMSDWRAVRDRIQEQAGWPFFRDTPAAAIDIDRFIDGRLRHHKVAAEQLASRADVTEEVKTLYRIFSGACYGEEIDPAAVDAVRLELEKVDALIGPVLVDLRQRDRRLTKDVLDLQAAHASAAERAEALTKQLSAAEEQCQRQRAESDSLAEQVAQLNARAAEAAEQSQQQRAESASLAEQVAQLTARAGEAEEQCRRQDAELDSLRRQLVELEQVRDQLRLRDNELQQIQEELERERSELTNMRSELDAAQTRLSASEQRIQAEMNLRGQAEAAMAAVRERLSGDCTVLEQKLKASEIELEKAASELERQEAESRRRADELNRTLRDQEQRLAAHFGETASLSKMLLEREEQALNDKTKIRRIVEVHQALAARPRWWAFLPRSRQARLAERRLRRLGLFDADSYLRKNPDVAQAGMDPVHHYVNHGIDEGRQV